MNKTTSISSTIKRSEIELQKFLVDYATANDIPFALWRLPESSTSYLLVASKSLRLSRTDATLESLEAGFIFAPFDRESNSVYLVAEHLFTFRDGALEAPTDAISSGSQLWLESALAEQKTGMKEKRSQTNFDFTDSDDFLQLVHKSIGEIEKGAFEKVVPSRRKAIQLPGDFDVVTAFAKLSQAYPHAFVSVVNSKETGFWISATPELLVSVDEKQFFRTVALAGTQRYVEGMNLRDVAWTQKEIEEQALVERYIIKCFKQIRVREYEEHGPKTTVAGNLIHLKSDFKVDMKAINFPQLGSVMLQLLHPTSAVCGAPLDSSLEFLKKHEGYERGFYSGYLGPVNVNNTIDIFVNLRCMQVVGSDAILYAGAGVTIDSVPEKELEETEIKFNTLINVIF